MLIFSRWHAFGGVWSFVWLALMFGGPRTFLLDGVRGAGRGRWMD